MRRRIPRLRRRAPFPEPDVVLHELAEHRADGLVLASLSGYLDLVALLDPEADAELSARAAPGGLSGAHLTTGGLLTVRAYGCLIDFIERQDSYWRGWVGDAAWLPTVCLSTSSVSRGRGRA